MFWSIASVNAVVVFLLIYYKPIGLKVFDILTNVYTFLRINYDKYDPFKAVLRIHNVSYFCTDRIGEIERLSSGSIDSLLKLVSDYDKEPLALSINYSFSDWNQKFTKLIDLRPMKGKGSSIETLIKGVYTDAQPDYTNYNFDYAISILSNSLPENDTRIPIIKSNLEAYLRRSSTFECEQTLKLLVEKPNLMEFIYGSIIESMFKDHIFSYYVSDDLGSEFIISSC